MKVDNKDPEDPRRHSTRPLDQTVIFLTSPLQFACMQVLPDLCHPYNTKQIQCIWGGGGPIPRPHGSRCHRHKQATDCSGPRGRRRCCAEQREVITAGPPAREETERGERRNTGTNTMFSSAGLCPLCFFKTFL